MKCQLVSLIDSGRRARRMRAYPVIWWRLLDRNVRWYVYVAARLVRAGGRRGLGARISRPPDAGRRFAPGEWVRVRARGEIEELEQARDMGDVVAFIPAPMTRYCGKVFRVLRVLEHYYDEVREGLARAEDAVLLEGVTCDGSQLGRGRQCGRECLHFWKSSWLEPVAAPLPEEGGGDIAHETEVPPVAGVAGPRPAVPGSQEHDWHAGDVVRVRDRGVIERSLDEHGACEGIPFVAEHMAGFCGRVFSVKKPLSRFFDEKADYTIRLSRAYLLSGAYCHGRQAEGEPHCDRGCALVWHQAWLEPATMARADTDGVARDAARGGLTREVLG